MLNMTQMISNTQIISRKKIAPGLLISAIIIKQENNEWRIVKD